MYRPVGSQIQSVRFYSDQREVAIVFRDERIRKAKEDDIVQMIDSLVLSSSDMFTIAMHAREKSQKQEGERGEVSRRLCLRLDEALLHHLRSLQVKRLSYYTRGVDQEFVVTLSDGGKIRFNKSSMDDIVRSGILKDRQLVDIQHRAFAILRKISEEDQQDYENAEAIYAEYFRALHDAGKI